MPGVPSNKACERCKKRHLKCDETRPACQRCTTAGVECPGYVQTRKFIDQGATVRRRYAPYQGTHARAGAAVNADRGVGHASSSALHENQSTMSYQEQTEPFGQGPNFGNLYSQPEGSGLNTGEDFHMPETSDPQTGPSSGGTVQNSVSPNTAAFAAGLQPASNAAPSDSLDQRRPLSAEGPPRRSENEDFEDIFSELMTGTEHELAFLTRHYAEYIGPWLDLSDSRKFFSVYVPIRAINCESIKYAMAALSAKQLGRIQGVKSATARGIFTSPATTETYPNATQVDWFLKAANYYYLAASDLNTSTSGGYTIVSSSAVLESPVEMVSRWLRKRATQGMGQDLRDGTLLRTTEEMLATIVLLTFYKLLDMHGEEWHIQLSGIRSLFASLLKIQQMEPSFFSSGIRASFWNFARYDYLGSYFTRSPTHFDPRNISLWRAAGISIDDQEKLHIVNSGSPILSQEDQAADGLTWLVCKVINFLAKSKQSQIAQWTGSPSSTASSSQNQSMESSEQSLPDASTWLDLCFEFQTWFEAVPETFRPCVRIERPRHLSQSSAGAQSPFPEVFHSLPTCAATMQHYHFGRIALLLNRPADNVSAPSTAFDRLQGYREVTKEVEYRCREVSGIALGRPQGEVRIYMIPLLFAVGQCLESAEEHQIIVDLLRGVEADLGWATEYVVQKLQASWRR